MNITKYNYNRNININTLYKIDYTTMKKMQKEGAIVIDVRSKQEYLESHLYKAINIVDYEIIKKHKKVLPNKNMNIIVYCQNGGRSKKAYIKLRKLGYKNVYDLKGGLDNIK